MFGRHSDETHSNRAPNRGTQLSYFALVLKEGVKVVKLNSIEVDL